MRLVAIEQKNLDSLLILEKNSLLCTVLLKNRFLSITNKLLIIMNIAEEVKAIIVDKLGVDKSEVTETANFTNDLGADSLDTVELIMEFEKKFEIDMQDVEDGEKIATVGDAISYIESKVNAK